jgi:hypothetical protein
MTAFPETNSKSRKEVKNAKVGTKARQNIYNNKGYER